MSTRQPPDPDNPIEYYLQHRENSGKSVRTIEQDRLSLSHLVEYLESQDLDPSEATYKECNGFISWLQESEGKNVSGTSARHYAGSVNGFYQFYSARGVFETNPMAVALDENPIKSDTERHRREISIEEMREFIRSITEIQLLAMILVFTKTGIRLGELINLDLRDLYIDHEGARRVLPEPRPELAGKPDSMFIDSNVSQGDVVNGSRREYSNKRKMDTVIPIDEELKRCLLYWIAARPSSPEGGHPLFSKRRTSSATRTIGERASRGTVSNILRMRTKEFGWYSSGGDVQNNVTPHYFRHFFTTHMRNRIGDTGVVKYVRGDVGEDIIDLYTHNWNGNVREVYLGNIYSLFSG